jgi:hypothetical protein
MHFQNTLQHVIFVELQLGPKETWKWFVNVGGTTLSFVKCEWFTTVYWFIKLWKFCRNILLKMRSTVFSAVKERCDAHARSVNTKTQYCSSLLQNYEWSVCATIYNVACWPVRTYRFFKMILHTHILHWQYTWSVISFLIFQPNHLGTISGYIFI